MTLRPETTPPETEGVGTPEAGPEDVVTTGAETVETVATAETAIGTVRIPPKPTRAPRRRAPKLDDLLATAVDTARDALAGLAEDGQVGEHVSAVADDDRLVTHRFTAALPGYGGWEWYATLSRAPRSKHVTVCEVGLLPGEDAILAPDWLPWSERASQEEKIRLDAIAAGEDPAKALARFRGEDGGDAGEGDPGDGPDEGEDADDVDSASDAADPDAGEDGTS